MANYEYIAKTASGEDVTGLMQAESAAAVTRTLDDRNLFPVRVTLQGGDRVARRGKRLRVRDVAVTYAQLADLLRAGVPLLRALDTIIRATPNAKLAEVLTGVRDDVSGGETLADAVAERPDSFAPLHAAMIRAGEEAGFLEDVLTNLAGFMDRQDDLRSKVRGAMIYPAILCVVGVVLVVVMLVYFVPEFQKFFRGISQPWPTRMLFTASSMIRGHWPLLLTGLAAAIFGIGAGIRSEAGHRVWARWQLAIPILGRLFRTVGIARFCRILGTMLHNGVPILQALAISKDATGNPVLAGHVEAAADSVRHGEPLAEPLKASGLFPVEILEMIAVAEESNQLEKVLVQIADTVDRRTSRQLDQAVRLVEPLILVVIAGAVGLIAVGLLYPIFTMAKNLG
jgi:type II secretory pathway component PulF